MPYYEWSCDCGYEEVKNYSISSAPKVRECPQCNEHSLTKLIGRGCMIKMDGAKFFKEGGRPAS